MATAMRIEYGVMNTLTTIADRHMSTNWTRRWNAVANFLSIMDISVLNRLSSRPVGCSSKNRGCLSDKLSNRFACNLLRPWLPAACRWKICKDVKKEGFIAVWKCHKRLKVLSEIDSNHLSKDVGGQRKDDWHYIKRSVYHQITEARSFLLWVANGTLVDGRFNFVDNEKVISSQTSTLPTDGSDEEESGQQETTRTGVEPVQATWYSSVLALLIGSCWILE